MKEIRTEQDLVAISAALIGSATMLSKDEAALLKRVAKRVVDAQLIASVRARIEDGEDPLGDAFSGIRSPEERRSQGATYTPLSIIQSMVNWAAFNVFARSDRRSGSWQRPLPLGGGRTV
ncbi:hypothetical protein [Caballeronia sp. LZ019]|uniref:hypothetical protein n=1 Tax=Caballeronia sp. LZ019 TaxID=3038555 RepID=UPI00285EFBA2|nr:hypothetical protein [Caballeronia sp. LZ019]MDR5809066.1 hypothetical protein [Caballeronia sp. LZ019]